MTIRSMKVNQAKHNSPLQNRSGNKFGACEIFILQEALREMLLSASVGEYALLIRARYSLIR